MAVNLSDIRIEGQARGCSLVPLWEQGVAGSNPAATDYTVRSGPTEATGAQVLRTKGVALGTPTSSQMDPRAGRSAFIPCLSVQSVAAIRGPCLM